MMQQQALMAEKAKKQFETEGKIIASQKDFTEEQQLANQQFHYDMALEAVKHEAAGENA